MTSATTEGIPRGIVTLTTDFGAGSEHVGALHAVLVSRLPGVTRVDFAHDIPIGEIRWGAIQLQRCVHALPEAVHLAVVDPGVGSNHRRPVAVQLRSGGYLVGPDNGLLGLSLASMGAVKAVEIDPPPLRQEVSATFHGRDIFAPAAARLASGEGLTRLGADIDPHGLTLPHIPEPVAGEGILAAEVVGSDAYGNVSLLAGPDDLALSGLQLGSFVQVEVPSGRHRARISRTFSDAQPGETLVFIDSHGMVSIAVNRGSAVDRLDVISGELCCITREGFTNGRQARFNSQGTP